MATMRFSEPAGIYTIHANDDGDGWWVCVGKAIMAESNTHAAAERIAACLNALAGYDTKYIQKARDWSAAAVPVKG